MRMLAQTWIVGLCLVGALPCPALAAAYQPVSEPGAARVRTNTRFVQALAVDDAWLWAATRGGLERHGLGDLAWDRVYTTEDGLASNVVWSVESDGVTVRVQTDRGSCEAAIELGQFHCASLGDVHPPAWRHSASLHGARVTDVIEQDGRRLVATAGQGIWLDGPELRRLGPDDQLCENHIVALAEFAGRMWLGAFDGGLCHTAEFDHFTVVEGPFRMVNELLVVGDRLYVASTEGLFWTADGVRFAREDRVDSRGVNGLATDGRSLFVTTAAALWRIPVVARAPRGRTWWRPGASSAIQSVAVSRGGVWLASEDRGALLLADGLRGRGQKITRFDALSGMPTSWLIDIAVDAGGIAYASTLRDGVFRLEPAGAVHEVSGSRGDWGLAVDVVGGRAWFGTQNGARVVEQGIAHAFAAALPDHRVHAIGSFQGNLVVATQVGILVVSGSMER